MTSIVPVVLFTYARPNHLSRVLDTLRANQIPLIYAFSDGPKTSDKSGAVAEVRGLLHAIDWCEVKICEREQNLGLGRSIRTGVTEVLQSHESIIVVEDDLVCVPGTYQYLCAALNHYRDDPRVMSVTGWNHPRVTPAQLNGQPYFDGRAECWIWGTWDRAWQGMDKDAKTLMLECERQGIDIYQYGADLPEMAQDELLFNIWAVRFFFLHILKGGLSLRPPHSMVEHIGFDRNATNAVSAQDWENPPLHAAPTIPNQWPEPVIHPECSVLWQLACGNRPSGFQKGISNARRMVRRTLKKVIDATPPLRHLVSLVKQRS